MKRPNITAPTFDAVTAPSSRKVWGAPSIARVLGLSVDSVYRLANDPDCPIYRPSGRYFAYRVELERWLRTKPEPETR